MCGDSAGGTGPDVPDHLLPYLLTPALSAAIGVLGGPLVLSGPQRVNVDSELAFRWLPSTQLEFEGECDSRDIDLDAEWSLETGDSAERSPVHLIRMSPGSAGAILRGHVAGPLHLGADTCRTLRFCLTNFRDYIGSPVRFEEDGYSGTMLGRLTFACASGDCRVDVIREAGALREVAKREPGFVLTHVGEWRPSAGSLSSEEAADVLEMLHFWFGMLRGAWTGPLFPQGLDAGAVVWRRLAPWKVSDSRSTGSWMPELTPLELSPPFAGFTGLWNNDVWRAALRLAIAWYIEANAARTALESRVIMSQVALELLGWVHLVEATASFTRKGFKAMRAEEQMRALLQSLGVPTAFPPHMTAVQDLGLEDVTDGPSAVVRLRNALTHQTPSKRAAVSALDPQAWYECTQLALQYVEWVLLGLCGYRGRYARRAWKGWKGDDEVLVPWVGQD